MKRILVTGISGFIGWSLANALANTHEVIGVYGTRKVQSALFSCIQVDLTQEDELVAALAAVQPDTIVHCAALSQPNQCELNPNSSFAINVAATQMLAKLSASEGIKLVFTSSDLVFDGERGNYAEDDSVNPINLYGEHKALAERVLSELCASFAICRMPIMFGTPSNGAASFIQGFLNKLNNQEPLQLFHDEYRSILHATDAVDGLIMAAEKVSGIIHLGGKERLSRYDFGLLLAENMGFPTALIHKSSQKDIVMPAKRAADVSLNSSFAYASSFKPLSVEDRLKSMASPS